MHERPPPFIDCPAAWQGQELLRNTSSWHYQLSTSEIDELLSAATRFTESGESLGRLSVEQFALQSLCATLKDIRHTLMHGVGLQLISGLPVDQLDRTTVATIFCGIGAHIGHARSQNAKGHLLGHVRDQGADASNPTTRIYQTSARQSFHTDSADVVGLLCLNEAKSGGESLVVSTVSLYNDMQQQHPGMAEHLFFPVATDRRGEIPPDADPWFEIPVFNWHNELLTGCYQRQYIESAQRYAGAPQLTAEQTAALDCLDALANDPARHLRMRLQPGDMQFVYNHPLLHDRTSFEDWPEPDRKRHLLRLWLSMEGDRELPPCFKQRHGTIEPGNRGGVVTAETQLQVALN